MPPGFLARGAAKLDRDISLEHALGVCLAWLNAIRRPVFVGIINDLGNRNDGLSAQQPYCLILLFTGGFCEAIAQFSDSPVQTRPPGRRRLVTTSCAKLVDEWTDEIADELAS